MAYLNIKYFNANNGIQMQINLNAAIYIMHMPQVRDDRLFSHLYKSMSQKALLLTRFTCLPDLIVIRERD